MKGSIIAFAAVILLFWAIIHYDVKIGRGYEEILRTDIAWCHDRGGTARLSYSKKFEGCLVPPKQ